MLRVENVHKAFGNNQVLQGVSLTVNRGEVVVLLGPSGSGKTTLLRCLNFLERADAGQLELGDLRLDFCRADRGEILQVRRKTAFVFQGFNLFRHRTALENVMEGLVVVQGMPPRQARELAMEALCKVGLSDKGDAYPCQLSGGQQQRVAIARAIVLGPDLILMDEPTSALDPELVGEVLQVIKRLADEGVTMIVVTHETSFAYEVADNAVFMADGGIVEQGPPRDLFRDPGEARTRQFLKRILPEYSYEI